MTEQLVLKGIGKDLDQLVEEAVELLRAHEPAELPYWGCFSGGKDSTVIKELARLAGVKVEWHYNMTTIDPPELVRHIRKFHPDVRWERPRYGNFFRRLEEKKGFPTRRARWCCDEYKEARVPAGTILIMGIRAEESANRAAQWRDPVQKHWRSNADVICPILGWASDEVWQSIKGRELPYCELYDEGFHRLGCVGCPMAGKYAQRREFARWPGFERRWKLAFKRLWDRKAGTTQVNGKEWVGSALFDSWEELWDWWLSGKALPKKGGWFDEH